MIEWLLRKLRIAPAPTYPAAQAEADGELRKAQAELQKSERQAAEAKQVAGKLQRINRENHFAERALITLR